MIRLLPSMIAVALAVCVAGAVPAAATTTLRANDGADSVLLYRVLHQDRRPLLASLRAGAGGFGPPRPIAPPYAVDQQDAVVDDAGGVTAVWKRDGPPHTGLVAAVRPPGGTFGPPQRVSTGAFVDELELAGNASGDAMAVWSREDRPARYSLRPAGGRFTKPRPLPGGSLRALRAAVVDADGGALVLMSKLDPKTEDATLRSFYRPRDGAFGAETELPGDVPDEASIASNRRGDVLIAWTADGEVRVAERPTGGTFGPSMTLARSSGGIQAVALGPNGDAVVAVGAQPLTVIARDAKRAWSAPSQVNGVPGGNLTAAVDGDGAMALAWTTSDHAVEAVYKPAGGEFGQPIGLAGARLGAPGPADAPSLSIGRGGAATAVWEASNGELVSVLARDFGATGAATPDRVARFRTYVRERPRSACRPAWGRTVKHNRRATIFEQTRGFDRGVLWGCLFGRGAIVGFDVYEGGPYPPVRLVGPLVGAAGDQCDAETCETTVDVTDLRDEEDGVNRDVRAWPSGGTAQVPALVLKRDGAVAWVSCAAPFDPQEGELTHGCTARGRARKRVFAWDIARKTPRQIGVGRRIDPRSLTLRGGRLSWKSGTQRHSSRLR